MDRNEMREIAAALFPVSLTSALIDLRLLEAPDPKMQAQSLQGTADEWHLWRRCLLWLERSHTC